MATVPPAPRQLLTALLNAISSIPAAEPPRPHPHPAHDAARPRNALEAVPPPHRRLLTTLHVLHPGLVLPALDLLDRGLVTRLLLLHAPLPQQHGGAAAATPAAAAAAAEPAPAPAPACYLVRSARAASRRRGPPASSVTGRAYTVRLAAWNCTCAAFAFAAFPAASGEDEHGGGGGGVQDEEEEEEAEAEAEAEAEEEEGAWSFGGMSRDGRPGRGVGHDVPCCKHLLACLLAERWAAVLGAHVGERTVGREELAGLVADV